MDAGHRMLIVALAGCLAFGCAMLGGDEGKSGNGVSNTPRKNDSVTMKNNDVLLGTLDLADVTLVTPYLPALTLQKRDIDTIEFFGEKDAVKVRTKHGDVLRGTLSISTFKLTGSKLPHTPTLHRKDIKIIHCK